MRTVGGKHFVAENGKPRVMDIFGRHVPSHNSLSIPLRLCRTAHTRAKAVPPGLDTRIASLTATD
jgi:hypothetical protein